MNKCKMYFAGNRFLLFSILLLFFTTTNVILSAKEKEVKLKDFLNGDRILFLGDSITQDGRYVTFIEYYLHSLYHKKDFDIISIGLSSETVSGLTEPGHQYRRPCLFDRLDSALIKIKPKVIISCYGMNDGIYHPQSEFRMKAYQDGINKLIDKAKSIKAKLVIITPPMFDIVSAKFKPVGDNSPDYGYSKPYHRYNDVLGDYAKWLKSIRVPNVIVVDLHTVMTNYILEKRNAIPDYSFCKDGVHPQDEGHLFMAQQFMLGLKAKILHTELDKELEQIKSDSLFKLVSKYRIARSKGWLSYIGFTLDKTVKTDEVNSVEKETAEVLKQIYSYLRKKK